MREIGPANSPTQTETGERQTHRSFTGLALDADGFSSRLANYRFHNKKLTRTNSNRTVGWVVLSVFVAVAEETNGHTFTKVMEALPMGSMGVEREMRCLLAAVCRDHEQSDVLTMAHSTMPRSVSRAFGFVGGIVPPLPRFSTSSTMVVSPLDPTKDGWSVGGRTLTSWNNWQIADSEQDTAYWTPSTGRQRPSHRGSPPVTSAPRKSGPRHEPIGRYSPPTNSSSVAARPRRSLTSVPSTSRPRRSTASRPTRSVASSTV